MYNKLLWPDLGVANETIADTRNHRKIVVGNTCMYLGKHTHSCAQCNSAVNTVTVRIENGKDNESLIVSGIWGSSADRDR